MRYLAIDYGTKRTGLAICDQAETIASPLTVIQGQKDLIQKISEIIDAENVDAVILGLPLNMDGSEGPQAKLVLAFAGELKDHIQVPVYLQDERLSSFGAERKLQGIGLTRGKKRERIDALAAAEILQGFLEGRKSDSAR